ncbi:HET-domain-containing protein [Lophiostoma macrostomum CBS 122681]|uniref:HET-domain-containing protein n=1 Tax=Lophiostoma macrostomum CBS 122681 TaxID=1314788 RepID=A0A6A6T4C4_9PLEO|nr:HET-domain-containing protein [Lophiostoma macrostomum CBS 122681]
MQWADECFSGHQICNSNSSRTVTLPYRILDISLAASKKQIILLEDTKIDAPYVCLGHCWDPSPDRWPLRTTLANIERMKKGIPWELLPLTFQQAVDFVRRMQKRYLWIDSLCIVQDDEDDWLAQAKEMANIYQNSFLTLAAAASVDSSEGLYRKDDRYQAKQIRDAKVFPLMARAWTYQERLLSPRVLYFNYAELSWECGEGLICECRSSLTVENGCQPPKHQHHLSINEASPQKLGQRWRTLVQEYTLLKLTKIMDRFPAIYGVGKQMTGNSHARLVSGLWSTNIILDLLWTINVGFWMKGIQDRRCHCRELNAPTWSWVCISLPVAYHEATFECTLQQIASVESFGQDDRSINNLGPLVRLYLSSEGFTSPLEYLFTEPEEEGLYTRQSVGRGTFDHWGCPDTRWMFSGPSFECLWMVTEPNEKQPEMGPVHLLLILKCVDNANKRYIRIGIADCGICQDWNMTDRYLRANSKLERITLV